MARVWDVAVLGVGGVGAFALRELARRGVRALGIERFTIGHDRGSSHGGTRVFRHAYFEHPDYVPLLRDSTDAFRQLQEDSGRALLETCGTLLLGHSDCSVLTAALEAARKHDIRVRELDRDQLAARWPMFALPFDFRGVFEPGGGFVRPEVAVVCAAQDARRHGAELRESTRVVSIEESGGTVHIHTDQGLETAQRLLVTAGAWSGQLLAPMNRRLQVTRQVQGWVSPPDSASFLPNALPSWFLVRDGGPALYGVPADPRATGTPKAKVALHGRNEVVDPDAPRREVDDADRAELMEVVETYLPRLAGTLTEAKSCLYTMTPDGQFVIDRAPGHERVWVAAGLSGHGFKLTPAIAKALVELALDGASERSVEFLRLARWTDVGSSDSN